MVAKELSNNLPDPGVLREREGFLKMLSDRISKITHKLKNITCAKMNTET